MALGSCACQSPYVNPPTNPTKKQDELTGAQGLARESNARSNETLTKAPIFPEAPTLSFIPPLAKDLFTKFMKVFIEITQAWD